MDWKIIDGIIAAKRRISIEHNFHNSSRLPIRSPRDGSRLARIRCLKRQHCDEKSSDFQRERKKRVTHWFPLHRHLNHKLDKTEQRMKETRPRNSNLPLPPQIEKKKKEKKTLSKPRTLLRSTRMIRLNSVRNLTFRMEKANTWILLQKPLVGESPLHIDWQGLTLKWILKWLHLSIWYGEFGMRMLLPTGQTPRSFFRFIQGII